LDGDRWGVPLPFFGAARRRSDGARIGAVIDLVDAKPFANRPIGAMSGGEQQRLLLAQALVREPSLLLLDEPPDSLRLPNQQALAALLDDIRRKRGVTILLVAHDVNPILPYVDQVVYLAGGKATSGAPADVI